VTTTRRAVLTATPAAVIAAAVPATALATSLAQHPDAKLIALGAEFDRRYAAFKAIAVEARPIIDRFLEHIKEISETQPVGWDNWCRISVEMGHDSAVEREMEAAENVDDVSQAIRDTPATTVAGIAVKMKAAAWCSNLYATRQDIGNDPDLGVEALHELLTEAERLAGMLAS
jgi:hypothetical protein